MSAEEIEDFLEAMDFASLSEAERDYVSLCVCGFWLGEREALDAITRHGLAHVEDWAEGWEDLKWLREGHREIRRVHGLPEVYET